MCLILFPAPDLQSTLTEPLPFRLAERALLPQRQLETVEEQKEEGQQQEEHDQGKGEQQQKEQQLQQQQEQHDQQQQQQQLQRQQQTGSRNITTEHGMFNTWFLDNINKKDLRHKSNLRITQASVYSHRNRKQN